MNKIYDIGIIGSGIAGSFAAYRAAEQHKDSSVILFDFGRPPGKRRKRQLEGFLGCFPIGDGKLYPSDISQLSDTVKEEDITQANSWVMSKLAKAGPSSITKNKQLNKQTKEHIEKLNYNIINKDFIQWVPDNVHKLSRIMNNALEKNNCEFSFENEIYDIIKKDDCFVVSSELGDFYCKKILICVGRSGWRWANKLFKNLGMTVQDDYSYLGIRFELPSSCVKYLNKSHIVLKNENYEIGPLCWNGTIIPEDHTDLVISSFRSNEGRWKTDKVSFSLISKIFNKDKGQAEMERLAKLAYLLFDDRINKEKVTKILKKSSKLSQLPEYDWLVGAIDEVGKLIPEIITRGYFYAPNIMPTAGELRLGNNLETEVNNIYVAGESAGFTGIIAAAVSGVIAIDNALR